MKKGILVLVMGLFVGTMTLTSVAVANNVITEIGQDEDDKKKCKKKDCKKEDCKKSCKNDEATNEEGTSKKSCDKKDEKKACCASKGKKKEK